MKNGDIICGNSIDELHSIKDEAADLVYLDPPFYTNREFANNGHTGKLYFNDKWEGGLENYLNFMRTIIVESQRILKPTGSLYVHCDWHAVHYLKVEIDDIFGYNHFRNEIIWKRHNSHNDAKQGCKLYGRIHDSILFYSKTDRYTWNTLYRPYKEDYIKGYYRHVEKESGRLYALGDLSGPGGSTKGNPFYKFLGFKKYWRYGKDTMNKLYEEGKIVQSKKSGIPYIKRYLDEMRGCPIQDLWDDVGSLQLGNSFENLNYPTQKPIALLERMILASTNPGDLVIDPFCGSGTSLVTSEIHSRKWLGIDISSIACELATSRIRLLKSKPEKISSRRAS